MRRLVPLLSILALACHDVPLDVQDDPDDADEQRWWTRPLDDRTAGMTPVLGSADLDVVAELDYPPGNVALSQSGRLFFSYHPEGNFGDVEVAELVEGVPEPLLGMDFQDSLHTVLAVRVDGQNRLWLLDYGDHGIYDPRLLGIDLDTDEIVVDYRFDVGEGPFGSLFNDFQVSPDGQTIFISDQSVLNDDQAIVVVQLDGDEVVGVTRRIENHDSVEDDTWDVHVDGRHIKVAGLLSFPGGVDGIAVDPSGEWVYYAPLDGGQLYRLPADVLASDLADDEIEDFVETVADTTLSDGMTTDRAGHVYLTDMEHSALVRVGPDGSLVPLFKDEPLLRWPDGYSWSPEGDLYVTASALHLFMPRLIKTAGDIASHAPYHILRFDPGLACDVDQDCTGRVGH